jgi:glycerol-3-phosphate acyltransferase PlsY
MRPLILMFVSYLLGSISFSLIISKLFYQKDIRDFGSSNAGATNTLRVLGKKASLAVVVGDLGKTFLALYLVKTFSENPMALQGEAYLLLAGLFTMVGHIWPVWSSFRGGKGVACYVGTLLYLYPYSFLISLGLGLCLIFKTRYVSLGSMALGFIVPIVVVIENHLRNKPASTSTSTSIEILSLLLTMAFLILFTHRENIKRLRQGQENKI